MYAEVIVDIAHSDVDRVFDYKITNDDITLGSRVEIPFGNRLAEGFVIHTKSETTLPKEKIKEIIRPLDEFKAINFIFRLPWC